MAETHLLQRVVFQFKNETSRRGYDIALKRFPFDKRCDESFRLRAIKGSITWEIYQQSIQDTLILGFEQSEAEWLVYEYYCLVLKCPEPVPEVSKNDTRDRVKKSPFQKLPVIVAKLKTTSHKMTTGITKVKTAIQNWFSLRPKREPKPEQLPDDATLLRQVQKTFVWFKEALKKSSPPLTRHSKTTQFDSADEKHIRKVFREIRKQHRRIPNPSALELNTVFEQLDSMVEQLRSKRPGFFSDVTDFRASVARKLTEIEYSENCWGLAIKRYRSILEFHPHDTRSAARVKEIDNFRMKSFTQIEVFCAGNDVVSCIPIIRELRQKLADDPETDDFLRQTQFRLSKIPIPPQQIQTLIDEKKWQMIDHLFEELDLFEANPRFENVRLSAKKRLKQVDDAVAGVRETMHKGDLMKTKSQIAKLSEFISDHEELGIMKEEFNFVWNHSSQIDKELKVVRKQKHWIKAENIIRRFLVEHPIKAEELLELAQVISAGVVRYQNLLRFCLLSVIGGITVMFLSTVSFNIFQECRQDHKLLGVFLSATLGFMSVSFILGFIIRRLQCGAGFPETMRLGETVGLLLCCIIAGGIFVSLPEIRNFVDGVMAKDGKSLEEEKIMLLMLGSVLPVFLLWAMIYPFQTCLYGLILRCIRHDARTSTVRMFLLAIVLTFVIMLLPHPKIQGIFGGWTALFLKPQVVALALWGSTCYSVCRDYQKDLDASFRITDFRDYCQRHLLLSNLKTSDFGKKSLLDTEWYHSVQKSVKTHLQHSNNKDF